MADQNDTFAMRAEEYEARLRDAMLRGAVTELDELLSDDLIFTNQDGMRLSKSDDLAAHASGMLKIHTLDNCGAPEFRHLADATVVRIETEVTGSFDGQPFSGFFAYTRIWHREDERWKIIAGHCSPVTSGR